MRIAIKKILCPVDFSECSEHALQYAATFARSYNSRVVLLHVVEMPYLPSYSAFGIPELYFPVDDIQQKCRTRLDELIAQHACDGCEITGEVLVGNPFVEIVKKAEDESIDLIVIGTHGHGGLKHMIIGSVAEKIVRKAPCPVLSVKHPEHEFIE